jgi:hypothetical protein
MSIRCYSELIEIPTFEERYRYLRLNGSVGQDTFGFDRYMNQAFYQSREWKRARDQVILRDNGCDLGVDGYTIYGKILIHHMNPITVKDIATVSNFLMNPEYLICVSHTTHNAIHYGDENLIPKGPIIRTPNDTCPWRS